MQGLQHTSAFPPHTDTYAAQTHSLSKRYGKIVAVDTVDLAIHPGEIFGIVGPDGAGKTTLLQLLAGLIKPASGSVTIFGEPVESGRANLGYVTQQFTLPEDLTVEENLVYSAGLRNVPQKRYKADSDKLLKLVGLSEFKNRLAGKLSGGMKEKLAIACALIGQPKALLLDEPTTGVDPLACREFQVMLVQLSLYGTAIILATPNFDEIEMCDRVAFIHHGKIRKTGSPRELRENSGVKRLRISAETVETIDKAISTKILAQKIVDRYTIRDGVELLVASNESSTLKDEICKEFVILGLVSPQIEILDPTLESIFALSTGEQSLSNSSTNTKTILTAQKHLPNISVKADNLLKRFGQFTAVNKVSFQIEHGEIFGLLGANGAGKTTIIKMLCGLQRPSKGSISILGKDPYVARKFTHARIGYMNQKFSLYDGLTVEENISFYAWTYDIPVQDRKTRVQQAINELDLESERKQQVARLPRGLKQRVAFAAATIHEPDILLLDEPTAGTDPLTRRRMWSLTNAIAAKGATVLVTTHYLDEAEFCNRIACMVAGNLVAQGSPSEIRLGCKRQAIAVRTSNYESVLQALSKKFEPWRLNIAQEQVRILSDNFITDAPIIEKLLQESSIEHAAPQKVECTLEDAFISYVADYGGKNSD